MPTLRRANGGWLAAGRVTLDVRLHRAKRPRLFTSLAAKLVSKLAPAVLGLMVGATSIACDDAAAESEAPDEVGLDLDQIPVPPADGPPLFALKRPVTVAEKPEAGARIVGELSAGAVVARSELPISHADCAGGWYAVRPRGFVCVGEHASIDGGPTMLMQPDLTKNLPYRYAEMSQAAPRYHAIPSVEEQLKAEPDLKKHLAKTGDQPPEELGNGVDDLPVNELQMPSGPPVLTSESTGVDADGRRTTMSFFDLGAPIAAPYGPSSDDPSPDAFRRLSVFAVAGVVTAEGPGGERRFAATTDGGYVPIDRLQPLLGTTWFGLDVREVDLPVSFIHKYGSVAWEMEEGGAVRTEEEFLRRRAIPMSGRFRTIDSVRYEHATEGFWLRHRDTVKVVKRSKLPPFATGKQKWLDVSIANQTLTVYEGAKPLYVTLVSSGRDMLGDPESTASTPLGDFHVRAKFISRAIDDRETDRAFSVTDVPWVLELDEGVSLYGSVFRDRQGQAMGHRAIALSPIDARFIWHWIGSPIPEGWNGVVYPEDAPPEVIVNVRK